MAKLAESINQYASSALVNLNVPEFKGSPNEDVREFLSSFKMATLALNDELKCLAIRKSLGGSAKIWAKDNLRQYLSNNDWKGTKSALLARFESSNVERKNLERLSKLKFNKDNETLLSYMERFAEYYKRAHKSARDSDVIIALQMNLPGKVQRSLNIINDEWIDFQDLGRLFKLAKRVEERILAYDSGEDSGNVLTTAELAKRMMELKELIQDKKTETVAAIGPIKVAKERNRDPYRFPPRSFNDQRPQQPIQQNRRYEGPVQGRGHGYQNRPNNHKESPETPKGGPSNSQMQKEYERKYGKPPGPCWNCGAAHFNRHCPLVNDLN